MSIGPVELGATATGGTPFKKLYLIDIAGVANGGTVAKTELVDLMNIADPDGLNGEVTCPRRRT